MPGIRWRIRLFIAASLLTALGTAFARDTRIMLISEQSDASGAPVPLGAETSAFFAYLEKETGTSLQLQRYPWKRALDMARQGQGFVYGASKTPERLQNLIFSEPIYTDYAWLVVRCDARFPYNQTGDLKGKTIGIVRDTTYGEEFDAQKGQLFQVEDDLNNSRGRFLKLYLRRMDALLIYSQISNTALLEQSINHLYAAATEGLRNDQEKQPFCVLPRAVSGNTIHIAVAPGYDDLYLKKLNRAIVKARAAGLLHKWFQSGAAP